MKRAQRLVGGTRPLEWKIAANDLHDVTRGGNLLDEFLRKTGHGVESGLLYPRVAQIEPFG
jgi:hypothetical protein